MSRNKCLSFLMMILLLVSCKTDSSEPKTVIADPSPDGESISKLKENENATPDEAFGSLLNDLVVNLKKKNAKGLNSVVSPEHGLFYIFPSAGMYNDFAHYNFSDSLMVLSGQKEPGSLPLRELITFLNDVPDSRLYMQYIEAKEEEDVHCSFRRTGVFADKKEISYSGLTETYNELKGLGITVPDEDGGREYNRLKNAEKAISRQVILGVKGKNEIYSEMLYFGFQKGKWYLIAIDLTECGL